MCLFVAQCTAGTSTPPMGWMSWEIFRCDVDCDDNPTSCINEALYKAQTDALVAGGYLAAGYNGIHIDDCWMQQHPPRDAQGRLVPNATRFPSGFQGLGDYMHAKGVKFAIYTAESPNTCAGYPASEGYETVDALTFASWGVDYLKVDGCGNENYYATGYPKMGAALRASGRNITYSCSWPAYLGDNEATKPYQSFIDSGCNLWRNWDDIQCNWQSLASIIEHWGEYGPVLQKWASATGPYGGHFNDPDMLLIGNTCISDDEARTQMSIWSIVAAPLIMGNDLRTVSNSTQAILLNTEAIAVNQDSRGLQGLRLGPSADTEVWARLLDNGDYAVALYNKNGASSRVADASCDSWNQTNGGYLEACGGPDGDILCFSGQTVAATQAQCCANAICAGFSYRSSDGSGCLKKNSDCGFVQNAQYSGYYKPQFTPPGANITVSFGSLGNFNAAKVRDIWQHADLGTFKGSYTAVNVPLHGTAFLRVSPL